MLFLSCKEQVAAKNLLYELLPVDNKIFIFCQKLLSRVDDKMMLPADNEMEVLPGEEL
jgi:hypothetical protein